VTGPVEVAGRAGIAAEDMGMDLVEGRTVMEGVKDRKGMFEVAVAVAAAVLVEVAVVTVETVAVAVVVVAVAVAVAAVAEGAVMGLANSGSESGHLFDLLDFQW
jgi:hypothetical protein